MLKLCDKIVWKFLGEVSYCLYTERLQNLGISDLVVILQVKINRKQGIIFFRLRLRFREKCVWRSVRCPCTNCKFRGIRLVFLLMLTKKCYSSFATYFCITNPDSLYYDYGDILYIYIARQYYVHPRKAFPTWIKDLQHTISE